MAGIIRACLCSSSCPYPHPAASGQELEKGAEHEVNTPNKQMVIDFVKSLNNYVVTPETHATSCVNRTTILKNVNYLEKKKVGAVTDVIAMCLVLVNEKTGRDQNCLGPWECPWCNPHVFCVLHLKTRIGVLPLIHGL